MKKINQKVIIIYGILILYLVLSQFVFLDKIVSHYSLYINPIFWLLVFLLVAYWFKEDKDRIKQKTDKAQVVFIVILFYLMIWFFLGLFLGYTPSPYSHSILGICRNVWSFFVVILFQEYIRSILVQYTKDAKFLYVVIVILFSMFEINFMNFTANFGSGEMAFKYISSTLFPVLIRNILCTYLASVAGVLSNFAYRLPLTLANLVLPIYPNLDWFMTMLAGSILPIVIYLFVQSIQDKRKDREYRGRREKHSVLKNIPFYLLFFIFICFVAGFFKYAPTAIASNSMSSLIVRGDVVIIENITKEEISNLKINDIIKYRLGNHTIVHRIVKIKEEKGEKVFITKGDNNNAVDQEVVHIDQVMGIVRFKIPKIGYPTVWLSEFFDKTRPDVET